MSVQAERILHAIGEAPVTGVDALDAAESFLRRFCAFPDEHALVAVTLWAAHAHVVESLHTTPRLALLSPEPGSGKTRVLEVLDLLTPEPMFCLSASPATIFRTLADKQVTLLFDEVDAIFAKRGKDDSNEDLRALLNAGYKRGATIPRCVGPKHDVHHFKVFSACALAGLGDLPDTVMTRSIIIRMKRRAAHEPIEPFRSRLHEPQGNAVRDRLANWIGSESQRIGAAWPQMPEGIVDRPEELWEPLISVADAAGGRWPDRARAACVALCKVALDRRVTLGIRLLSDLRIVFGDSDALHTRTILERLCAGEHYGLEADAPWSDLHGKPLGERGLASILRKYDVQPAKVKVGGVALQGYRRDTLHDAWARYLPHPSKRAEPPEPLEPDGGQVPLVPEVPAGSFGERCRDCRNFNEFDGYCDHLDRPMTATDGAGCHDYGALVRCGLPEGRAHG